MMLKPEEAKNFLCLFEEVGMSKISNKVQRPIENEEGYVSILIDFPPESKEELLKLFCTGLMSENKWPERFIVVCRTGFFV